MDKNLTKVIKDIQDLKIQGATNIARSAILALAEWSKHPWRHSQLKNYADKLAFARPTEPLTQNCLRWLISQAKQKEGKPLTSQAEKINLFLTQAKDKLIKTGTALIKNRTNILTHCHSSSVVSILVNAKKQGKKFQVFLTETRPRYQGHLTAQELIKQDIKTTLVTDSEAPFIISHEDKIKIDLVIVGADAIDIDGSAVNKVGSYSLSLASFFAKVPFYVAAVLLKFSPAPIVIEERKADEVWQDRPKKLKIINPAFDKIPSKFITAFITELGLIKPQQIKNVIIKNYPWVFHL